MRTSAGTQWQDTQTSACHFPELFCLFNVPAVNALSAVVLRGLPTDRYMWSDASGLRECTKDNTSPPSPQWTWVQQHTMSKRLHYWAACSIYSALYHLELYRLVIVCIDWHLHLTHRFLIGLLTTVSQEGQIKRAGSMLQISQCMLTLNLLIEQ